MTEEDIPRIPKDVWKDLRGEIKRIEEGFKISKNAEACAMNIQRLQKEFEISKKFHIGLAPPPGKVILIKL